MTWPLCGYGGGSLVLTLPFEFIFDELERQWGTRFDAATRQLYSHFRDGPPYWTVVGVKR